MSCTCSIYSIVYYILLTVARKENALILLSAMEIMILLLCLFPNILHPPSLRASQVRHCRFMANLLEVMSVINTVSSIYLRLDCKDGFSKYLLLENLSSSAVLCTFSFSLSWQQLVKTKNAHYTQNERLINLNAALNNFGTANFMNAFSITFSKFPVGNSRSEIPGRVLKIVCCRFLPIFSYFSK